MQSLHSAITPAHLPFLARSPPWSPLLHLPCTRPSTTPPILQLSDFPTSRKVEKPTNRKVGKLAPTTGRGSTTPPNAAKTSHLPPLRPLSFTLHHTCPFPSLLLSPGKPRRPVCARTHSTTRTVPAAACPYPPPCIRLLHPPPALPHHQHLAAGEHPPPNAAKTSHPPLLHPRPPPLQVSNFPTSQQVGKPTSWQVGKPPA